MQPVNLMADADQIEQLLINLVKNAVDAAVNEREEAGLVSKPAVTIRSRSAGDMVSILIEDNGPGLTNPGNLFVPFYTTKTSGRALVWYWRGRLPKRMAARWNCGIAWMRSAARPRCGFRLQPQQRRSYWKRPCCGRNLGRGALRHGRGGIHFLPPSGEGMRIVFGFPPGLPVTISF